METSVHMYSRRTFGFRKDVVCHQVNKTADVMFTEIQSISWHYGEFQQWMLSPEYSSINFIEGLPDMASLDPAKVNMLIIDDLMHEMNEVVAK